MEVKEFGRRAKLAAAQTALLKTEQKNEVLRKGAVALLSESEAILAANERDMQEAKRFELSDALIDRLLLTQERIQTMADALCAVAALKDPIGEVLSMDNRPNGLMVGKKRVPLGVVGLICEAQPNVVSDAFGLCLKSGNAILLRCSEKAFASCEAIVSVFRGTLSALGLPEDAIQLLPSTDPEAAFEMMRMDDCIDVLIPCGGEELIRTVVEHSTVPVIRTGIGNCHIFVDRIVDFEMALTIIENAKTQRYGVSNAAESLIVHSRIAEQFLPMLYERLSAKGVTIRADERARGICPQMEAASEEDFAKEYLGPCVSLKLVDHRSEAIEHINRYSSGHSEAIITKNYSHAMQFLNEVDSAVVYVNASTRFTDGGEFGLGAEVGISTQKLHARGPLGLQELTTTKYIVFGNGQIKE